MFFLLEAALPYICGSHQAGADGVWGQGVVLDLACSLPSFPTEKFLKKEDRESWKDLLSQVQREPITPEFLRGISK